MTRASQIGREAATPGPGTPASDRTSGVDAIWAFGPVAIALASNDSPARVWLSEFLEPWFSPTKRAPDWRLDIRSSRAAYVSVRDRWPVGAERRACFALDQRTSSLPACDVDGGVRFANVERSCFFTVRPGEAVIVADPTALRWRFAAMRIIREIAATRLRRTSLDLHAAAVERGGRAILICGPKFAGKTTLAIHLLRSGECRLIANDRVFIRPGAAESGGEASARVLGVPTAVKIRPATVEQFPELRRNLPRIATPYLYTRGELTVAEDELEPSDAEELSLMPSQVARQLGVEATGGAPPGAIVFPEICDDADGMAIEPVAREDAVRRIRACLYGERTGIRAPTVFEEMDGGPQPPRMDVADAIAGDVRAFRVVLGRRAYEEPAGAARLLGAVSGR